MFLFGVWLAGGAVLAANLLRNPGFERGNTLFETQQYWPGTVEHIQDAAQARTGKGVIRLVSEPGRGAGVRNRSLSLKKTVEFWTWIDRRLLLCGVLR